MRARAIHRSFSPYPEVLDDAHVDQFHELGYLAFADFLSSTEVKEVCHALLDVIACFQASALNGGTDVEVVNELIGRQNFVSIKRRSSTALVQLEPGKELAFGDLQTRVRKVQSLSLCSGWFEQAAFKDRITSIAACLLGDDPILYDEMALLKPANGGMEMPLHQDSAYMTFCPPESTLGIWVALDKSCIDNGGMYVIPRAHKLGPLAHSMCPDSDVGKAESRSESIVVHEGIVQSSDLGGACYVELEPGGVLIFSGQLPHGTRINNSAFGRRAVQYHYRARNTQVLSRTEYVRRYPGYFRLCCKNLRGEDLRRREQDRRR